ncbi:MAG: hypothetical protein J5966_06185 [Lachnospiraceae bacterium]|nr:hypothetical protein [Lachnospiraceae bacterium]
MIDSEIREQTAKLKNMNARQRLRYIWDYYKVPIIAAVILIYALISFIHGRMTYKPTVFNLIMIDSNVTDLIDKSLLDGYAEYNKGFNPDKEQISLHADYHSESLDQGFYPDRQKLMMEYGAGAIDATIAPGKVMEELGPDQAFADLTLILPESLMEKLESSGLEVLSTTYEDPATKKTYTYPFAINISEAPAIKKGFTDINGETLPYFDTDCYLAISPNSEYMDNCISFIDYLLKDTMSSGL